MNLITRNDLVSGLSALGLVEADTLMLHASVKSVGWIVGGPNEIIRSILDITGKSGTLMMYVGWADSTYEMSSWPEEKQQLYLEHAPPFDPATSPAVREWSILAERLRTWSGASRSGHPEASVVAIGAKADWITENHPLQYGYGTGSPFEKLIEVKGKVLLLGSPLSSVTLFHHSECIAKVPEKRIVKYRLPMLVDGHRQWVEIEEYDTSDGIVDWQGDDYFELITRAYLDSGKGKSGKIGNANSHLLNAAEAHELAVNWMERNF